MASFRWMWLLGWIVAALPVPVAADEAVDVAGVTDAVQIVRHAACSNVVDREPVGSAVTFTATDGARLYLWCEVTTKVVPTTITHRYYQGERLIQEVPLAVRDHRWRTWSYHTMAPARSPGEWRIEVVDEWGNKLAEAKVTVTAP
jgi:hypothetical protein